MIVFFLVNTSLKKQLKPLTVESFNANMFESVLVSSVNYLGCRCGYLIIEVYIFRVVPLWM